MAYTVDWHTPDRILMIRAESLSVENLETLAQDILALLEARDHTVHSIWDFSQLADYPKNVIQIGNALRPALLHDRFGTAVTISDHPMIKLLAKLTTDMFRISYLNVDDLDAAVAHLREVDDSTG